MPKWYILASFWKTEACGQTVLPDRSVLKGQKLVKNAKIKKLKNATFWVIFKHCLWPAIELIEFGYDDRVSLVFGSAAARSKAARRWQHRHKLSCCTSGIPFREFLMETDMSLQRRRLEVFHLGVRVTGKWLFIAGGLFFCWGSLVTNFY